jgi:CheY-like chemotaxis protein
MLALSEHESFGVVLSDLGLENDMDGWELAARVRRSWPHVRFILTSGLLGIQVAETRRRGADDLLPKPFTGCAEILSRHTPA